MRASTLCFVTGLLLTIVMGTAIVARGGLFDTTEQVELGASEPWDDPAAREERGSPDAPAPDWILQYGFPAAAGLMVAGAVLRLADLRRPRAD